MRIDPEDEISGLMGSCPNLRFTVDSYTVTTDAETEYVKGKCSDVRNGRKLKVWGYLQADGTLAADRVEIK